MAKNLEMKLGYSQHVIGIVMLVLTLFSIRLPLSVEDSSILKLLGAILFVTTIFYVTIFNLEIISDHFTSVNAINTNESGHEVQSFSQTYELVLIGLFSLITWIFLYIGFLITFMFILRDITELLWAFVLNHIGFLKSHQNIINYWGRLVLYYIIGPVVTLMLVDKYVNTPLKEQVKLNVICHPKDELIIGKSYEEPLWLIIKNVGNTEIEIKEFFIELPEGVIFKLRNKEFEKNVLTLEDLKQLEISTTLVPKKQTHDNRPSKYKIDLKIYPKYNSISKEEEKSSKIYDYVLIYLKTDKSLKPITKYLDAVITL